MTDELQAAERRYLLERPQWLGIVPTPRFWRDTENWRLVRWPFAIFSAVLVIVLSLIGPHPLVAGLIAGGTLALVLGSFERYIRKQAMNRRALAESTEEPQTSPSER